ncbi:MAG: hypothetical protein AB7G11_10010 [Phycisphaerales bacterium]
MNTTSPSSDHMDPARIADAKEHILRRVQGSIARRRRVRQATRASAAAALLLCASALAWIGLRPAAPPTPPGPVAHADPLDPPRPPRADPDTVVLSFAAIHVITPPRALTVLYELPAPSLGAGGTTHITAISDQDLIAVLASTGRDVGLVRVGDPSDPDTDPAVTVVCNSCASPVDWLSPATGSTH